MRSIFVATTWVLAHVVAAQSPHAALEKYLTDDVVAVAYLDLSQIDAVGMVEWAENLGFGPKPAQRGQAMKASLAVQAQLDRVADYGARYVYVLFRVTDLSHRGPSWVLPVAAGGNSRAVLGMLLSGRPDSFEIEHDMRPGFFPEHCEAVGGFVVGANSPAQLEQLKSQRSVTPRDLTDAWKNLGSGHFGLILLGDSDSRRVVREMFPKLPAPFEAIDGSMIADRLLWGGVVGKLPPELSLQVIVQTDQESSAKIMQQAAADGLACVQQLPLAQQVLSAEDRQAIAATLAPEAVDSQLMVSLDDLLNNVDRIARLLAPPVKSARQAAYRAKRMNDFREILLAMLNYESAKGTFPPRSTFSDDGKPLLSWRVHVLPYMGKEELALYRQFRLDEPWDSEHNKQLIPLMPEVYADPDPALAERNSVGRTTYVVPTGPGTVFAEPEGALLKNITDGTSNTIALVEVWSMAGPFWTRPKDWLVDYNSLWERLPRDDRKSLTVGFCDGSVHIIDRGMPAEKFRAWLTSAGSEVIE